MANYNYSFTFFVCFCFGLLILFVDFVILLYLILICHSYCFRLFVSFPFGWCINSVSGIVFLFSGCGFVLFSLLDYRFSSCVSVLGLRLSVFLFCFYRPQYKLNRYSLASKLQTTEDNFTRQPYRDEASALVWIECLVLIGAQNITSFNLEQTINERINLSKTEKGGKKCLAPLVVSDLRSSERSFYHYTSIRSHTLSICKFMTYSVTTLQECGHLTVAGVFWQWKTAPSSLLYFSIEVTKIVVPSLTKSGVKRTIYSWLKNWLTIISSLVSVLIF